MAVTPRRRATTNSTRAAAAAVATATTTTTGPGAATAAAATTTHTTYANVPLVLLPPINVTVAGEGLDTFIPTIPKTIATDLIT